MGFISSVKTDGNGLQRGQHPNLYQTIHLCEKESEQDIAVREVDDEPITRRLGGQAGVIHGSSIAASCKEGAP